MLDQLWMSITVSLVILQPASNSVVHPALTTNNEFVAILMGLFCLAWRLFEYLVIAGLVIVPILGLVSLLIDDKPHARRSNTSVCTDAYRQIDTISESYLQSVARLLFGR